jgi:hypothetical protein
MSKQPHRPRTDPQQPHTESAGKAQVPAAKSAHGADILNRGRQNLISACRNPRPETAHRRSGLPEPGRHPWQGMVR